MSTALRGRCAPLPASGAPASGFGASPARQPGRRRAAAALVAGLVSALLVACSGSTPEVRRTPTQGERVPILSRIATQVVADPTLANVAVVVPPPVRNPNWPQAGGNAAKVAGHMVLAANPTRAWTASFPGSTKTRRLAASPVVAQGMVFVVDSSAVVHAFDAATGARRWQLALNEISDLRDATFGGGVAYDDGRLYAADGVGDVVAIEAATGKEIWRVKPTGTLRGSPTIAFNTVFVMTQDNQIYALRASNGEVLWQDAAASGQTGVFGVASPAAGQGTVVAGYSSGELIAYRYENGRNLWSDALSLTSISTQVGTLTDVDADPIIDQGRVYALGQGGRMAAYELLTGQRIWELTLAGISTPDVVGDWIFTLTDDSRILAIQRGTGRIRWMTQLERWRDPKNRESPVFWTGPVLANNRLWIASSRGEVKTVDINTGEATDFARLPGGVSLPPVIADATLYLLEDSGRLSAWR